MKWKIKKKGLFSKLMVVFIIALNIWFTNKVFEVVTISGTEPSVLVGSFFAFTTGELWMLCSIKKTKSNVNNTNDDCNL